MSDPVVLACEGLVKEFRQGPALVRVLSGVNASVRRGERVAVVGASGSGKTTLLQLLGGLDLPTAGRVLIDGREMSSLEDGERGRLRNAAMGFVYQFHHLLPELNAVDNVAAPLMINGMSRSKARKRGQELLRMMGLNERDHHRPGQLSGGEQQRVAIARSLANKPKVLIADEPTGNLDPNTSRVVFQNLFDIARHEGVAVLVATHNVELTTYMDRVLALHEGRLEPAPRAAGDSV
jgi:lipoprotein-releasing system ATP-binding protein